MSASKQEIIKAYRDLYRSCMRTVRYAKPQRYVARDRLRQAFRAKDATFEPAPIARTLEFLDYAAKYNGLEHKIVKNLIFVWWTRGPYEEMPIRRKEHEPIRKTAFVAFDETLRKLNETMGLCLR